MSKYSPLGDFLQGRGSDEVPMTFGEIEKIIGARLPPKAQDHRAWWSNNASNNVMTKVWLSAGYKTERVDMAGRRLVFRRLKDASGEAARPEKAGNTLDRIRKALAGTVHIPEGVDITQPTGEVWDAQIK